MKAIVYSRYGAPDVLALTEVAKPTPGAHEVLIQIHATTVTAADWRARSLSLPAGFGLLGRLFFGVLGPRRPILGTELAGEIEAVGSAVTRFAVGDRVFAFPGASYGCHAEYRTMPEDGLIARMPANLSFAEAASLSFGGTNALSFLRDKGGIERGDRVLVVGASGGVGTAAVQLAKHFGAEVTGVCSTANLELVRSLGADEVIDYTKEDFASGHELYDIILDTTGTASFARCGDALKPGGRLVEVQGSLALALGLQRPPRHSGKKVIAGDRPQLSAGGRRAGSCVRRHGPQARQRGLAGPPSAVASTTTVSTLDASQLRQLCTSFDAYVQAQLGFDDILDNWTCGDASDQSGRDAAARAMDTVNVCADVDAACNRFATVDVE